MKLSAAFNVTHFESRITDLLYTAINTTEHVQVSQCLGFTKSLISSTQRLGDILHDNQGIAAISQVSVLRNICNLLTKCIFKAVNIRESVSKNLGFQIPPQKTIIALKMQFVRRLQMLRRTHYVAFWQVHLGDGSNSFIVMEDISKTLY